MAATGLLYLAILSSFVTDLAARAHPLGVTEAGPDAGPRFMPGRRGPLLDAADFEMVNFGPPAGGSVVW